MKTRITALLLALVMAVCCLTGCTSTRVRSYSEESSDASTDKYAAALDAYKSNKKVMTINGSPVYWNEYAYFLCAIMANMERYGMQVSDWSAVYDESSQSTYADLMTESIVNNIAWNHLIEVKAAENDVTFDAAGEQFVQDTVDQTIRNVVGDGGTEAKLNEKLQSYYMALDLFKYFTKVQYLYNALAEKLFGADGANITDEDVQEYAAQEIRSAIAFIEEQTGAKWDWDYYFTCAKRVNETTRHRLEWLDINKTPYPQFLGLNLAVYTETNYLGVCGKSELFVKNDRKIAKIAEKAYRDKAMYVKEYRHRAIVWGVQSQFYFEMLLWLENCWGILPLTDMLSMLSTRILSEDDKEQAIYDMAWLTENMIMRNRTHGGYKVLLDELWEYCEQFNADMVILWEHMSCKALDGMHGMFEERAREHGIHLVWVTHDLFDPRVISRQGVREQVNNYMRTVMQEEPVDPSLEILKDEKSW